MKSQACIGRTSTLMDPSQEHGFYPSFGYQVTAYFAPSERFGPPAELQVSEHTGCDPKHAQPERSRGERSAPVASSGRAAWMLVSAAATSVGRQHCRFFCKHSAGAGGAAPACVEARVASR